MKRVTGVICNDLGELGFFEHLLADSDPSCCDFFELMVVSAGGKGHPYALWCKLCLDCLNGSNQIRITGDEEGDIEQVV